MLDFFLPLFFNIIDLPPSEEFNLWIASWNQTFLQVISYLLTHMCESHEEFHTIWPATQLGAIILQPQEVHLANPSTNYSVQILHRQITPVCEFRDGNELLQLSNQFLWHLNYYSGANMEYCYSKKPELIKIIQTLSTLKILIFLFSSLVFATPLCCALFPQKRYRCFFSTFSLVTDIMPCRL